jgi:hypothetical protein
VHIAPGTTVKVVAVVSVVVVRVVTVVTVVVVVLMVVVVISGAVVVVMPAHASNPVGHDFVAMSS